MIFWKINRKVLYIIGCVGLIILCAILFYFLYWVKTPAYSLGIIKTAIEKHDLPTFEQHVDLKSLYSRGVDDLMKRELGDSGDEDNTLVAGLVSAVKDKAINTMIMQTEKYVETGDFEKAKQNSKDTENLAKNLSDRVNTPNLEYKDVKDTQKDGKIAIVTITLYNKQLNKNFDFQLKMRELGNGEWQVVEVANLVDFMDAEEKAMQDKLTELNQPVENDMKKIFAVTNTVQAKLVNENSFFPTYYIHYQIDFTLPDPDKQVSKVDGTILVKNKDQKVIVQYPVHIEGLGKNYTDSTYRTDKIFQYFGKSTQSLNPFIKKEKQIAKDGIDNYILDFEVQKLTLTDGSTMELLNKLPEDK